MESAMLCAGLAITETKKAGDGVRFEMLVPPGAWKLPR